MDGDIVEAACLAHDLGHPPFGHIAEDHLDQLVNSAGDPEGYNGNAQTFRIVTRLALRFPACAGLDLTRGVLDAVLKYPWARDPAIAKKRSKWNAYRSDDESFNFARAHSFADYRCLEAEVMDFADDIAYSVHDIEDFHRCGAIPWRRILRGDKASALLASAKDKWFGSPDNVDKLLEAALRSLHSMMTAAFPEIYNNYEGSREQRYQLRLMTSQLVARFIPAIKFATEPHRFGSIVVIDNDVAAEIRILKQITSDFIVNSPSLVAQQAGQRKIIRFLFDELKSSSNSGWPDWLPTRCDIFGVCAIETSLDLPLIAFRH